MLNLGKDASKSLAQKSSVKEACNRPGDDQDPGPLRVHGSRQGRAGVAGGLGRPEWVQTPDQIQEERGESCVDLGMTAQGILCYRKPGGQLHREPQDGDSPHGRTPAVRPPGQAGHKRSHGKHGTTAWS